MANFSGQIKKFILKSSNQNAGNLKDQKQLWKVRKMEFKTPLSISKQYGNCIKIDIQNNEQNRDIRNGCIYKLSLFFNKSTKVI